MSTERRVLSVPSTEDPTSPLNHRQKLSGEYLEKALEVVKNTMASADEALAYKAAQWVAEMVMGKPKQEIENSGGVEAEMARMLGMAYASYLNPQPALPLAIEDGVYVLGADTVESPEVTEYVKKRKPIVWDELPQ